MSLKKSLALTLAAVGLVSASHVAVARADDGVRGGIHDSDGPGDWDQQDNWPPQDDGQWPQDNGQWPQGPQGPGHAGPQGPGRGGPSDDWDQWDRGGRDGRGGRDDRTGGRDGRGGRGGRGDDRGDRGGGRWRSVPLYRYYSQRIGDHWVTTSQVRDPSYNYESTLGYLLTSPAPGTRPLFECLVGGRDHMISAQPDCERQMSLGVAGYVRMQPAPGTVAIYRCLTRDRGSHFVSAQRNCEGHITEGHLGFIDR